MILFLTTLDINESVTPEDFIKLVLDWNAGSKYEENIIKKIDWHGERTVRYGDSKLWLEFVEYAEREILAVRHEKITADGVVWDSDFVMNFENHRLTIQLDRTYSEEALVMGAYFSTQGNVNGNWNWTLGTSFETPLDKQKLITLRQSADADYTHSVDFDVLYDADLDLEDIDSYRKSIVHNWRLHEQLALTYQKDKLTFGISGELNWRSATSDRQNFERISAFDYNYGGHLRYTIPWLRLYVGTDIKVFSRRGYSSDMMNTDDLVWNAEVSRSLLNEKLTLKLTAFDLLHQLSNKQYSINAQGRTETWNNCIPRYVMLTAAYKLNIM